MNFNNHYSHNYRIVPHIDILRDYSLSFIEGEPVRAKIDHDINDIFNYENIECSFYCDISRVQTETGLTINYFNHFDLTDEGINDWEFSGMTIEDNELINISPEIFEIYKNEDYYKDMYEKQHNLIFNVSELTGNTELKVGTAAEKFTEPIKGFIGERITDIYFVDESGKTYYYSGSTLLITGMTELTGVTEGEPFYSNGELKGYIFEDTYYFIDGFDYIWLSGGTIEYEEIDTTPYETLDMVDYETVIVNSGDTEFTPFYTQEYVWEYKEMGTITQTGNTTIHFENHLFNEEDYEQTGLVLWTEETEQNYFIRIDNIKGYYGPVRQESNEEEINNLIYTDRENKININITDDTIYWVPGNLLVNIKLWNTNGDNKEYNYRLGDLRKSLRKR